MYESPIEIIQGEMQTEYENGILRAIQKYDIHCNKEELIKALAYDRNQYERGYKDRDAELIRCKDCKHRSKSGLCNMWSVFGTVTTDDDMYCSYGARGDSDDE